MRASSPRLNRIPLLLLMACFLVSCKARPKVAIVPPRPVVPEALVQQYVTQGDREFSKHHLYGWRQAELAYTKAYKLEQRNSVKEKLLLTRFLIATREEDEDIPGSVLDDVLRDLCPEPMDGRQRAICELARASREGFGAAFWQARADRPPRLDPSTFAFSDSPLEAYQYALYCRTFGIEPEWDAANNPYEKFKDSPLFLYLTLGPDTLNRATDLEKSLPDFAELLAFIGEAHFQNSRYKNARVYFNKALALVPDYTRANNGLGNIYLFVLEDYENALKIYDVTLRQDPQNAAALFGKGATLHYLGRFEDSIAVLEAMLGTDLTRKGRTSHFNVRYYRGEGLYYQAYDYHLLRQPEKARQRIDLAKKDLPDSPEIGYLSGVLYFNEYRLEEAKQDFLRVLGVAGSNCFANYYLGLIYADSDQQRMLSSFVGAAACLEANMRNRERNIQSLATLDVEPEEREALLAKLTKSLVDFRLSAIELLEKMRSMLTGLQGQRNWESYLNLMSKVLTDLHADNAKQ
jgi:tetratricopeptide (TPR) repeat protein